MTTSTPGSTAGSTPEPTDDLFERAALRLAAGRARAGDLMPYLSDALYAVTTFPSTQLPTVGIDPRWRMHYNPGFVLTLDVAEVVGLWLHEVAHPLRRHHERFDALAEPQERHPVFNRAGDCAINEDLRTAGVRLPAIKAWYPERVPGAAAGMTAEQLYRLLLAAPAGERLARRAPAMLLLPATLREGHGTPVRLTLRTREAILTGAVTVALPDLDAGPDAGPDAPPGTGSPTVHDARTASVDLLVGLPAGEHTVEVTCGPRRVSAVLPVTAPGIVLRPDHLRRSRSAVEKVVVAGTGTRFGASCVVEVLDAGGTVLDVVSNVVRVSATSVVFDLGRVPDGLHLVRVRSGAGSGGEVVQAPLPVGLPFLDLDPNRLGSAHGTPTPLAGVVDDLVLDASTALEVLDPAGAPQPGATGAVRVVGPGVLNVELTRTLRDGRHLVVVSAGAGRAVATLTVGGGGQATDAGPADHDDCGSAAGGPRRAWEADLTGRGADGEDDGSVDAGRAELIRRQTARNVLEHARGRGAVPGGWERWAHRTLTPVVDWRRELLSVTRRVTAGVAGQRDHSYARPSRRAAALPGVVLPAMRQPRPPRAAVVLDTSASVSDAMLARVHAETEAVLRRCRGEGVQVIACDAAATVARRVRRMSEVRMLGGGGTDLRVGLAAAAALRPRVDLVITATDGDTPWPAEPPRENPRATYVVLLLDGEREGVPAWMRTVVVPRDRAATAPR